MDPQIARYYKAKDFIEHCKANKVKVSERELEAYEKIGLLFPIYRLVKPEGYVRAIYQQQRNPNGAVNFEDEWRELVQLKEALNYYKDARSYCINTRSPYPHFKNALRDGHPLDSAYKNKNPFLHKPTMPDFKPWKEYKVVVGQLGTAEHYYAPWQIFVVDELSQKNTEHWNYVTNPNKDWSTFKKEACFSDILKYADRFQTISNFMMMEELIWQEVAYKAKKIEPNGPLIVKGTLHEEFVSRVEAAAKGEYVNHLHNDWIRFIRKLTELYHGYAEREKINLSDKLKFFLSSTVFDLLMKATSKSFEEICDDFASPFKKSSRSTCMVDGVSFWPGALNYIFSDERKQRVEHATYIFDSYIKAFKENLQDDFEIFPNKLIENVIDNGHEPLLSYLAEVNDQ